MLKRVFDIFFTLVFLLLLMPVFWVIALAVVFDSKGPIFYRGMRSGLNGAPFKIFKFRTMVINAEQVGGGTTALRDPRITKVGGFLRRYKLDELPQVFNVLKGDMSLVGPRPELPQYTEQYNDKEKKILSVKPGITDYSSIKFSSLDERVGAVNADRVYEEEIYPIKNQLRLQYVQEQSFLTDMKILFRTIAVIIKKAARNRG